MFGWADGGCAPPTTCRFATGTTKLSRPPVGYCDAFSRLPAALDIEANPFRWSIPRTHSLHVGHRGGTGPNILTASRSNVLFRAFATDDAFAVLADRPIAHSPGSKTTIDPPRRRPGRLVVADESLSQLLKELWVERPAAAKALQALTTQPVSELLQLAGIDTWIFIFFICIESIQASRQHRSQTHHPVIVPRPHWADWGKWQSGPFSARTLCLRVAYVASSSNPRNREPPNLLLMGVREGQTQAGSRRRSIKWVIAR